MHRAPTEPMRWECVSKLVCKQWMVTGAYDAREIREGVFHIYEGVVMP
jgi:hypothetical protein